MLRGEADLTQPGGRLMCLALGLLFLHRQGAVDATLEVRPAGRGGPVVQGARRGPPARVAEA